MSNKRDLKKDINFVYEELIGAVYLKELTAAAGLEKKAEALIDKIIASFDGLIARVNDKSVENAKAHFRSIREELDKSTLSLSEEINS
jgi:hypothetical protein